MLRPIGPHVAKLLEDLEDCKADLAEAQTAEQAANARAEIHGLQHSLWLAGYRADDPA